MKEDNVLTGAALITQEFTQNGVMLRGQGTESWNTLSLLIYSPKNIAKGATVCTFASLQAGQQSLAKELTVNSSHGNFDFVLFFVVVVIFLLSPLASPRHVTKNTCYITHFYVIPYCLVLPRQIRCRLASLTATRKVKLGSEFGINDMIYFDFKHQLDEVNYDVLTIKF